MEELRELAHGIYPPLLAGRGLAPALSAVAARAPIRVSVQAGARSRYPPPVEATVYFCCLEALQNAGKHAGDGGDRDGPRLGGGGRAPLRGRRRRRRLRSRPRGAGRRPREHDRPARRDRREPADRVLAGPRGPDHGHDPARALSDGRACVVVDDQAPFRRAARAVVGATAGFELVAEARSGEEAVRLAAVARAGPRPDGHQDARHRRDRGHQANRRGRFATRSSSWPPPIARPTSRRNARTCGAAGVHPQGGLRAARPARTPGARSAPRGAARTG